MPSVAASLALALLSLACWGSWSNASKAAESVSFAVFYLDFSLGVFLVASAGLLLGGGDGGPSLADGAAVARSNFAAALASGGVFNVANLLLVVAIRSAGLAVAFPVGIGTALVLGTSLTYLQDPSGDAALLGLGVALALCAVLAVARAHRAMAQQQQQQQLQQQQQQQPQQPQLQTQQQPLLPQQLPQQPSPPQQQKESDPL